MSLDMRLQRFSKASDCTGEFFCVTQRMGSVIETKFGTKQATVLINPRNPGHEPCQGILRKLRCEIHSSLVL